MSPCGVAKNVVMVRDGMGEGHRCEEIALPTGGVAGAGRMDQNQTRKKCGWLAEVQHRVRGHSGPKDRVRVCGWRDRDRKHGRRFFTKAVDQSGCPLVVIPGGPPGARENAIMAHLMDDMRLNPRCCRCTDNSRDAAGNGCRSTRLPA